MSAPGFVLVVEDSPTQAHRVSTMIKMLSGLNVAVVTDGIEALRAVQANPPNVVVLDVNLPGMNGYQICRRLKQDEGTKHIPVIMLTAEDSETAAVYGLSVGVDAYIPKDELADEKLIDILRKYLSFR